MQPCPPPRPGQIGLTGCPSKSVAGSRSDASRVPCPVGHRRGLLTHARVSPGSRAARNTPATTSPRARSTHSSTPAHASLSHFLHHTPRWVTHTSPGAPRIFEERRRGGKERQRFTADDRDDRRDRAAQRPCEARDRPAASSAGGGDDRGAVIVAAARHGSRVELAVKMDMSHCDKGGHQACGGCVALLPGGRCRACGGFFVPYSALDAIMSSTKVQWPHAGCQLEVPYHEAADHRSTCLHASCDCTESGCGFVGPPQELAGHLAVLHSVPVHIVQYGRVSRLRVPVVSGPQHQQLLVGEDDGRAFLLTVGALGAAAAAVSAAAVLVQDVGEPGPAGERRQGGHGLGGHPAEEQHRARRRPWSPRTSRRSWRCRRRTWLEPAAMLRRPWSFHSTSASTRSPADPAD
ncbi:hypothetical protein ZWY2020_058657 [Hordeum vulgare]|nr:hypothetical protein ZWY2020_058657 [Hordeum vulgare]